MVAQACADPEHEALAYPSGKVLPTPAPGRGGVLGSALGTCSKPASSGVEVDYFTRQKRNRTTRRLVQQLEALGTT